MDLCLFCRYFLFYPQRQETVIHNLVDLNKIFILLTYWVGRIIIYRRINHYSEVCSNEKNVSTKQKKTRQSSRFSGPHGNSRRSQDLSKKTEKRKKISYRIRLMNPLVLLVDFYILGSRNHDEKSISLIKE